MGKSCDIFGKELSGGDLVVYMPGSMTINKLAYGMYTPYDTLLFYNTYIYNTQEILQSGRLIDEYINELYFKNVNGVYKVQRTGGKEEDEILKSFTDIYNRRVKGIETYKTEHRRLSTGDIIINRFSDRDIYLYLGKINVYKLYTLTDNGAIKQEVTANIPLYGIHKDSGSYYYLSISQVLRDYGIEYASLLTDKSSAYTVMLSGTKDWSYYIKALKSTKSNCYYFGHMNMGDIYDEKNHLLYFKFKRGTTDLLMIMSVQEPGITKKRVSGIGRGKSVR